MEKTLRLRELFDISEDLELRNAKLYARLVLDLGGVDDRVAKLWEEMSTEEWSHYIVLSWGRLLCRDHGNLDAEIPGVTEGSVRASLDLLKGFEDRISAGGVTLDEAFEIAIGLETSESDTIYSHVIGLVKEAIAGLRKGYLLPRVEKAEDRSHHHLKKLLDAVGRLSRNPALVRKARELTQAH